MVVSDTMVDNTKTSEKRWEGWYVTSYLPGEIEETGYEQHTDSFTKQDFEQALRKVTRKVKK